MSARVRFRSEFVLRSSPTIAYQFLTEPDCLTRWFCDECNIIDDTYYYEWAGSEESAIITEDIEEELLRLQWDEYPSEFLEFKFSRSEVTNSTVLTISGFCDKGEAEEEKRFWDSKIQDLKRAMGE
jgi:uncharacterized protein YndB with AHSA1/START domain